MRIVFAGLHAHDDGNLRTLDLTLIPMSERDIDLIERLLRNDDSAWKTLTTSIAMRIMRKKGYVEWLSKNGHETWEVLSELCILLHKDDCRLIRGINGSLTGWMAKNIHGLVKTVLDPIARRGGGMALPEVLMPGASVDEDAEYDAIGSIEDLAAESESDLGRSEYIKTSAEKLEDKEQREEQEERDAAIRTTFSKLWEEDPRSAYALLMLVRFQMSYAEIGQALGEKGNTVQQWVYRTRKWWCQVMSPEQK